MSVTGFERVLLDLPSDDLRRVLVRLIWEITVEARQTYEVGGAGVHEPDQLRAFNEVQHRISAALLHAIDGQNATAAEMVAAQIGEKDFVSVAVDRAMKRALKSVAPENAAAQ